MISTVEGDVSELLPTTGRLCEPTIGNHRPKVSDLGHSRLQHESDSGPRQGCNFRIVLHSCIADFLEAIHPSHNLLEHIAHNHHLTGGSGELEAASETLLASFLGLIPNSNLA